MGNRLSTIMQAINMDTAITSPNEATVRKMLELSGAKTAPIAVCLGVGDGAILRGSIGAKPAQGVLYVVDEDQGAANLARSIVASAGGSRNIAVANADPALFLTRMRSGSSRASSIVSILPLLAIGREKSVEILREAHNALTPNGVAVWLQNTPAMAPFIMRYFDMGATMVAGVPPAILYPSRRKDASSVIEAPPECPCKKKQTLARQASAASAIVTGGGRR